jgi:hypothetical protein
MHVDNVCKHCREYFKSLSKDPTDFYSATGKLRETRERAERARALNNLTPAQLTHLWEQRKKARELPLMIEFYNSVAFFSFASHDIFYGRSFYGRSHSEVLIRLYTRANRNPGGASDLTLKKFGYK